MYIIKIIINVGYYKFCTQAISILNHMGVCVSYSGAWKYLKQLSTESMYRVLQSSCIANKKSAVRMHYFGRVQSTQDLMIEDRPTCPK